MSAMEVVVTALAAGASTGMKDTASAAVQDAYGVLKRLLRIRMAAQDGVLEALEDDPVEPRVWQERIGEGLTVSGAADDREVIAAAEQLLLLADPARAAQLNVNVGTNYGAIGSFGAPVTFNQGLANPPSGPAA